MCGIAGTYHLLGRQHGMRAQRDILKAMTDTFVYRGPDEENFLTEGSLGFGFRRLAIIDLADGHQPINNQDGSITSICNGEIYNHQELRKQLQAKGYRFKTQCDIEVIAHLYEEQGVELLQQLNGQFAFALFDRNQQRFMLARDHVGIAPLFYTVVEDTLVFASEIKAILQHPLVSRQIDLTGLDQILSFPGMISPRTMFQGIHALKPGHYLTVERGTVKVHEYWDLNYPRQEAIDNSITQDEALEGLEEHLLQAVQYRLQADVPAGFYLSGGLDSSLVAGLIHRLSAEQRHSFSIGFEQQAIDERNYQHMMVEHVNSLHHETLFSWEHMSEDLQKVIHHAESPLKESYNTCTLALSKLVHDNDMRVVLTGEGADELFAGYVGYRFDQQRQQDAAEDFSLEALLEQDMQQKLWGDPHFFYEKSYHAFQETKGVLYSEAVMQQFQAFEATNHPLFNHAKLEGRHVLHKRSYLDFKSRLSDHLLADHSDRVAYANSVEARYPFLDVNLIDYVRTLPPHLMLKNMTEKYLLKQLAYRYVPKAIIEREKFSFVAPGSPYLLRQNIEWVNDLLSYAHVKQAGYFNPDTVERLKKQYSDPNFNLNQTFDDDFLMIVLTFHLFKQQFNMPDWG